jgi:SAM-dependent methyltransferase
VEPALPSSPAALRNRDPIAEVLRTVLPERGLVLEIASGTGEHAEYFAGLFPDLRWQPTDADPVALHWSRARKEKAGCPNLLDPLPLDTTDAAWPVERADAVLCSNMVHISPWAATEGLMRGAGRLLGSGAPLLLYGPYRRADVPTAPSNEAFDASLRARDSTWGLRTVEQVRAEAQVNGLSFERLVEMPANNLTLIFRRD